MNERNALPVTCLCDSARSQSSAWHRAQTHDAPVGKGLKQRRLTIDTGQACPARPDGTIHCADGGEFTRPRRLSYQARQPCQSARTVSHPIVGEFSAARWPAGRRVNCSLLSSVGGQRANSWVAVRCSWSRACAHSRRLSRACEMVDRRRESMPGSISSNVDLRRSTTASNRTSQSSMATSPERSRDRPGSPSMAFAG